MARKNYSKQHLSLENQVAKLKANGLLIHNEYYAQKCLVQYNYYRLSAYWHIFRNPDPLDPRKKLSTFKPNCTFESAILLYEFDKALRQLVFKAISEFETFFRTQLAYIIPTIKNDAFALYDQSLFLHRPHHHPAYDYFKLLNTINNDIDRAKHEDFIKHYKRTYNNSYLGQPKLPFWMVTEVLSFGTLKNIYSHLKVANKNKIVDCFNIKDSTNTSTLNKYYLINFKDLDSYLFLINKYRNICAHHGRLWNRKVTNGLKVDAITAVDLTGHQDAGLYALLIILARLLEPTGYAKEWKDSVYNLIKNSFPLNDISLYTTLPSNWEKHPIWHKP